MPASESMSTADEAVLQLGRLLHQQDYRFTTITPESHRRVVSRPGRNEAHSLRDVFGWSMPFARKLLPENVFVLMEHAEVIERVQGPDGVHLFRSKVRFSSDAESRLYVHSAFPTVGNDAVFFGPDTYRYLSLLRRMAPHANRAVDVGCGSGAGGLSIAADCGMVLLADINDVALRYATINAALNGIGNARPCHSNVLRDIDGPIDLVLSNPPYLVDDGARLYRDGGGQFGEGLSLEIVRQSMQRLESGGRLILYTATAIVDGVDTFLELVTPVVAGHRFSYEELDPDVFGEELESPVYERAERLAVVAMDVQLE
jgi:hypothetical protein